MKKIGKVNINSIPDIIRIDDKDIQKNIQKNSLLLEMKRDIIIFLY